ncbi:MAG: PA14 domain-containing protein [Planctomycetota bacterium]
MFQPSLSRLSRLSRLILLFCLLALLSPAALAQDPAKEDSDNYSLNPGVSFKLYHIGQDMDQLPQLKPGQLPNVHEVRPTLEFRQPGDFGDRRNNFMVEVETFLRVTEAGEYRFRVFSDDGSRVWINDTLLIEHDGLHGTTPGKMGVMELGSGTHKVRISMFQGGGGTGLWLLWRPPGEDWLSIPADRLSTDVGDERPTAQGDKQVDIPGPSPRPGTFRPLQTVHPAFTLEQARPEGFEPRVGGLVFLPDGRLAISDFPPANNGIFREVPNGKVWILENPTSTDTTEIVPRLVSNQFQDPLGLNWIDGALYVADRSQISKWTDTDHDGLPDYRQTLASGWESDNYHHFTFGLPYLDGHFYVALSTNISFDRNSKQDNIEPGGAFALNGPNPRYRGSVLRINAQTGEWTEAAGGVRTPNGISNGPDGTIVIPDNQGAWKPASGIYVVTPGEEPKFFGYYGSTGRSDFFPEGGVPTSFSDQPIVSPAVWLPQGQASNSPGSLVEIPEGMPYAGQFLMAEITLGGIKRVQFEKVNGVWQGAVYRHSHGFEAGTNRLAWGPDGCLYVGCMGASGNWSWRGKQFGLQRMRPTDQTVFEIESIHAEPDGLTVRLTKPVDAEVLQDPVNWVVSAWTYEPKPNYGGPKVGVHDPGISDLVVGEDGRSVRLVMGELKPDHVYHVMSAVTSTQGEAMWTGEAWYTLHQQPGE